MLTDSDVIASVSLLVSGISLGWNIFRDCVDKPKLKLNMYVAGEYDPVKGEMLEVISIIVTNVGKQPITIWGHCFYMKDKSKFLLRDAIHLFQRKKLEPYDVHSVTLPHENLLTLVEKADQIETFCVGDTSGKTWKVDREIFKEFQEDLRAKKKPI
jgi:hypothetical protein